jgi:hypothetical protein
MLSKNLKALIIALALTGLLIGGYQGAIAYRAAQNKKAVESGPPPRDYRTLASFEKDNLVKIEYPLLGLTLEKQGEGWEAFPAFPGELNVREMDNLVWSLANLSVDRLVEENPTDLSLYGLDQPRGRVLLTLRGGERIELWGGAESPSRVSCYLMAAGDPAVYLASSYSAQAVYLERDRIREKTLSSNFEDAQVSRLLVESDQFRIDIGPRPDDLFTLPFFSSHVLNAPYARVRGVNSDQFTGLTGGFKELQIQEFIDPAPASLAPYGLDAPTRVYIETNDGTVQIDLLLGKAEGGRRYAQRRGEREVFTITEPANFAALRPFELVEKFALILNIADVQTLNVRGGPEELQAEIRRNGEEESYFLNGKPAEEKSFKAWYQAVIGLMADAEHPQRPATGGSPEISIEFLMNKPAGARVGIRLIPYNRDFYALEWEGVQEFLISRSQVRAIFSAASALSYLD